MTTDINIWGNQTSALKKKETQTAKELVVID